MTFKNVIISGLFIFTLIFSAVAITSCSKNERDIITDDDSAKEEEVILKLSVDNISVDAAGGQEIIHLHNRLARIPAKSPAIEQALEDCLLF